MWEVKVSGVIGREETNLVYWTRSSDEVDMLWALLHMDRSLDKLSITKRQFPGRVIWDAPRPGSK